MTKVSRRFLNKHLEERMFALFVKTIIDLKDQNQVTNFLEDLLSPTEKIMLIKRLAIAILLTKNYTYDQIDNTLKVSRSTIMNVSYWLKHGKSGYQNTIKKILDSNKKEELFDKIEEILLKLSPPKRFGSAAFERKQKQGKELFERKLKKATF